MKLFWLSHPFYFTSSYSHFVFSDGDEVKNKTKCICLSSWKIFGQFKNLFECCLIYMLLAFYWALVISAVSFEFKWQDKLTADIHCLYHITLSTTLYVTTLNCCCNVKSSYYCVIFCQMKSNWICHNDTSALRTIVQTSCLTFLSI